MQPHVTSSLFRSPIVRFIGVGLVGLLIDATITALLVTELMLDPGWAKVLGFGVAVLATYFLHHRFTFTDSTRELSQSQFVYYFLGQCIGAGLNLICFLIVLSLLGQTSVQELLLAVVVASAVAAAFNYVFAARVVYVSRQ